MKKTYLFCLTVFLFSIVLTAFLNCSHRERLTIVVPRNFVGEVNLVLSNLENNKLDLDTNGIGYISKKTFEMTFTPIVLQNNRDITDRCVGFNPSVFWGEKTSVVLNSRLTVKALTFEVVPEQKKGQKQYYNTDIARLVDTNLIYRGNN
jgi:hypothetical protein